MLERIIRAGRQLIDGLAEPAPQRAPAAPAELGVLRPRVLLIIHNPPVAAQGGRRLTELLGWNDPDRLARQYAEDLARASRGYLQYQIVERVAADWFPAKVDGFRYTGESYLRAWHSRSMHEPDRIDYLAQVTEFDLIGRYNRGEIDEVWFLAFPFSGDYESTMVGRGAFWCNSPPVPHTDACAGRFVIMAFNYERDVGCMLENFGHRVESMMSHVFRHHPPQHNLWERFTRYEQIAPGQSQCGNVHFAPNSQRDYDWGNPRQVLSYCDDWYRFPELPGRARWVSSSEWGGGDMRAHHMWWLAQLPCAAGELYGVRNNWWAYVAQPMLVA